ncbi:MAG: hypothetical protein AWM53_01990 [Candidatus Dichloromethanomonas elyunquensis]|nr:MAG: hypothetical protein AWM53_01990 [Candidatus Dichloromethanomonas elyunquensis]
MDIRERAKILFEQGERLIDISDKLKINYNTIKQWCNRGKWKKPKKVTKKVTPKIKNVPLAKNDNKSLIEDNGLTEKQRLFCLYWVNNRNATQSYLKAYGCNYAVAAVEGHRNLTKPKIKDEINRLRELKKESIMIDENDIIEKYMRIAFSDLTDFIEVKTEQVPMMSSDGPIMIPDPDTGELKHMMQTVNMLTLKTSDQIDGALISEIRQGKQGVSIKLEDRQKALKWLADFFGMNPEHKHRVEYDAKKLQLEQERLQHTIKIDEVKVF